MFGHNALYWSMRRDTSPPGSSSAHGQEFLVLVEGEELPFVKPSAPSLPLSKCVVTRGWACQWCSAPCQLDGKGARGILAALQLTGEAQGRRSWLALQLSRGCGEDCRRRRGWQSAFSGLSRRGAISPSALSTWCLVSSE